MKGYYALLLRNPGFARLWAAQAISLLGDWFSLIALTALVTRYSTPDQAGINISLLLLARFLPPLIVGPFAGVLVDRVDRRALLIISDTARALIVLCFLLVGSAAQLWLIYVLLIVQVCFSALFEPGRSALMPSLVQGTDLVRANVLGSVTWSVMLAAGAAIGGVVASAFGAQTALIIDAVSFMLSAALILSIRPASYQPIRSPEALHGHKPGEGQGFIDGLRYAIANPPVAAALVIKLGGSVGSIDALMIIYATQLFIVGENGAGSLGLFYAAFGVGAVFGPALMQRFNDGSTQKMRRLVIVGYAFIVAGWFLFAGSPLLVLAAASLIVKAMGSSIYWTYSSAILQKTVPDRFLGRMFSLDLAGFQLMTVISVILTGIVTNGVVGDQVRLIVLGTGVFALIPLIVWVLIVPRIERYERHHPQPTVAATAATGD